MSVELEGLSFKVEGQVNNSYDGLDKLSESLRKLNTSLRGNTNDKLSKLADSLKTLSQAKVGDKAQDVTTLASALDKLSNTKLSKTLSNNIEGLGRSLDAIKEDAIDRASRLADVLERLSAIGSIPNLKGLSNIPQSASTGVTGVTGVTGTSGSTPMDTMNTGDLSSTTDQMVQAANSGNVLTGVLSGIASGASRVGSALKGIGLATIVGSFKAISFAGRSAASGIRLIGQTIGSKLASDVQAVTGRLGGLFSALTRVAMHRAIRAFFATLTKSIKEGVTNLYNYSNAMGGTFANSMDSMATSANYLKNSLGAMAAPLINAVAPAIDYVIDKLVTLFNIINQLFARLTGASTYTAAKKVASAYGGAAGSAADGANKAADKLKRSILAFDEINKLEDNSSSGSGGSGGSGGGGGGAGDLFEEIPIDSAISEFADKIKELFEAQDWRGLGELIGGKFNEVMDSIDWEGLGNKIGFGIDSAVKVAYWLLDSINWEGFGKHFGELLNGILDFIDFQYVGRLFAKKFAIIGDFIIGAIEGINWGLVAKSISDFFIGCFDEIGDFFASHDWSELGSTLYTQIEAFLTGLDWDGMVSSLFRAIGGFVKAGIGILGGFFEELIGDIAQWWNDNIKADTFEGTVNNILTTIFSGFLDIASWISDYIIEPFVDTICGEGTWDDLKDAAGEILMSIFGGIGDWFNSKVSWLQTHVIDPIKNWWKGIWSGIFGGSNIMTEASAAGFFDMSGSGNTQALSNTTVKVRLQKDGWTSLESWIGTSITAKVSLSGIQDQSINCEVNFQKRSGQTLGGLIGTLLDVEVNFQKRSGQTLGGLMGTLLDVTVNFVKKSGQTLGGLIGTLLDVTVNFIKKSGQTLGGLIGTGLDATVTFAKKSGQTLSGLIGTTCSATVKFEKKKAKQTLNSLIGTTCTAYVKFKKDNPKQSALGLLGVPSGIVTVKVNYSTSSGPSSISTSHHTSGPTSSGSTTRVPHALGGIISPGGITSRIPQYASGTSRVHGSMFIAGEAGAEVVGHINGHTEVLNRSQMASVMYSSMVAGMSRFIPVFNAINQTVIASTNYLAQTVDSAMNRIASGEVARASYTVDTPDSSWMGNADFDSESIVDAINEMNDGQNALLREQNVLLRGILAKDTTVEITANSIASAANRKNKRDGQTTFAVSM